MFYELITEAKEKDLDIVFVRKTEGIMMWLQGDEASLDRAVYELENFSRVHAHRRIDETQTAPAVQPVAPKSTPTKVKAARICPQCSATLPANAHPRRKYCDDTCRKNYHRSKKAAKKAATV